MSGNRAGNSHDILSGTAVLPSADLALMALLLGVRGDSGDANPHCQFESDNAGQEDLPGDGQDPRPRSGSSTLRPTRPETGDPNRPPGGTGQAPFD